MMYLRDNLPSEYDENLGGVLDTLAKIVGGGARILDKIRTGGRITVSPPGGNPVELDTRDPAFFEKVRQITGALKNAAGGLIKFTPNTPGSDMEAAQQSAVTSAAIGGGSALVVVGLIGAVLLLRRRRRA